MPTAVDSKQRLEDQFVAAFEQRDGLILNGANAGLRGLRKEAIERFAALGFPKRKAEAWKYTPINKVLPTPDQVTLPGSSPTHLPEDIRPFLIPGLDAHLIVLMDGQFVHHLSSLNDVPSGVSIESLEQASEHHAPVFDAHFSQYASFNDEVFTALNTAFTHDGLFVYVPRSMVVEKPIHVINLVSATQALFTQPRHLIVVEENSQVKIVRTNHSLGSTSSFSNVVTEAFVGARAHVDLYDVQDGGDQASSVNTLKAYQEDHSIFRASTFSMSGRMIRNNATIHPDAEHCESHLYGLLLGDGSTHVDNHTIVDHAKPQCFSNELYKNILDDRATGVFNGRVLVRQDAQQTNAYQSNKSILLTEQASMYSKPELEIYADDVQCSHGATTGQLDDDAIFYLRSRGLSEKQAKGLLLIAFARDVLENVAVEPLREWLDDRITARFH